MESRGNSDSEEGRIRPALVAGFFILFRVFFAGPTPDRLCAPPGAETFRSEIDERNERSLTTEGSRHRVMRISRFAWRDKPQILLESSVMWKGELAFAHAVVKSQQGLDDVHD